jgi:signal transduction histidine kinase
MDQPAQNNRIICVDDEVDIVQAYIDFLAPTPSVTPKRSSRGPAAPAAPAQVDAYVILKAHSGEEAVATVKAELAAGRRVAGGFFDVKMEGGMDGIQAIQEIWKLDPEVNATIVTAYQDRSVQDINQLFGSRFKDQWDYLNKPFTQGEIVQKARQMTASWNRRRNLEDAMAKLQSTQLQLIATERMAAIGQVARGVGHEFGNILQRIVGKADLALNHADVPKIHESLKVILQASERATVIVRNLQSLSRVNQARGVVEPAKVIGEILALMNHEFVKGSVTVEDKRANCSPIKVNAGEIQQVLMNLMINAIHAMPSGGKLEVGCGEDATGTLIWVKDNGSGIPPDVLPRIFDYAFTTKGEKGSGLGLSISKQIVESHGGRIHVESVVGKGSLFALKLPKAGGAN